MKTNETRRVDVRVSCRDCHASYTVTFSDGYVAYAQNVSVSMRCACCGSQNLATLRSEHAS